MILKRKRFNFLLVNICGVQEWNFVFDAHKLKSSQEAEILVSKYCLSERAIWGVYCWLSFFDLGYLSLFISFVVKSY
ncbi:hypothetical protein PRO82_001144 [Candidatus Protochlamydia amoebophila]|nr:hypothetical protein [Candidatus Protochlamydia amoebophila]